MSEPFDYGLCQDTVTVYRYQDGQVKRQVLQGCYFSYEDQATFGENQVFERKFTLIVPCKTQEVFPGDRVLAGIGPEVEASGWAGFIPACVPALAQVEKVRPVFWDGALCHLQAGNG